MERHGQGDLLLVEPHLIAATACEEDVRRRGAVDVVGPSAIDEVADVVVADQQLAVISAARAEELQHRAVRAGLSPVVVDQRVNRLDSIEVDAYVNHHRTAATTGSGVAVPSVKNINPRGDVEGNPPEHDHSFGILRGFANVVLNTVIVLRGEINRMKRRLRGGATRHEKCGDKKNREVTHHEHPPSWFRGLRAGRRQRLTVD